MQVQLYRQLANDGGLVLKKPIAPDTTSEGDGGKWALKQAPGVKDAGATAKVTLKAEPGGSAKDLGAKGDAFGKLSKGGEAPKAASEGDDSKAGKAAKGASDYTHQSGRRRVRRQRVAGQYSLRRAEYVCAWRRCRRQRAAAELTALTAALLRRLRGAAPR